MNNADVRLALKEKLAGRKSVDPNETSRSLPLTIHGHGADLREWAAGRLASLESQLLCHGAILFRGFNPFTAEQFEAFVRTVSPAAMDYTERSSPRTQVSGKVFTSTDYPPGYEIFPHNENSYAHLWPRKVFFQCMTPASSGGETPLVDVRRVYERIPAPVREKFEQLGVRYVRNFSSSLGIAWQEAFQTTRREDVEELCRAAGYTFEWRPDGHLRTVRVGQATAYHPVTRERLWFNHAAFFHVSTLEEEIRQGLLLLAPEDELPNNTYYGDGSPIEPGVLDELRAAYRAERVMFPWRAGDVLMVDNMLVAHGRSAFRGSRRVLVAMTDPYGRSDAASENPNA